GRILLKGKVVSNSSPLPCRPSRREGTEGAFAAGRAFGWLITPAVPVGPILFFCQCRRIARREWNRSHRAAVHPKSTGGKLVPCGASYAPSRDQWRLDRTRRASRSSGEGNRTKAPCA